MENTLILLGSITVVYIIGFFAGYSAQRPSDRR